MGRDGRTTLALFLGLLVDMAGFVAVAAIPVDVPHGDTYCGTLLTAHGSAICFEPLRPVRVAGAALALAAGLLLVLLIRRRSQT